MGRLGGKVALITGGAGGIGEATVRRFIAEGARVVFTDINENRGRALATELGQPARFIVQDVSKEESWPQVIGQAVQLFGGLHILVNNAGYGIIKTIETTTLADWRLMASIHSEAIFLACKCALPEMLKSGSGSIINVSSTSARFGMAEVLAYSAAKASQHGFTRSLAAFLWRRGYPVRCNAVLPGGIETPLLRAAIDDWARDLGVKDAQPYIATLGQSIDVANMILFLASDESRYVSGQTLLVDGGRNQAVSTHQQQIAQLRQEPAKI